jgi:two-component system, NarL family, response regulator NreC
MMPVTIALADDHNVVRQALRMMLESRPDFVIVGEAEDGLKAVQMVRDLSPQVLVLDLMMPGLNGLEVTRQVSSLTRVIILSMHDNEAYVVEALRNGAYGYVLKDSTAQELLQAVETVAAGQRYLCQPFSAQAIELYTQMSHAAPADPYDSLTARERQVLQLSADGLTAAQISARLSISPRTVEIHRANFMRKLSLHSQAEVIKYALKRGVIKT